MKASCFHLCFLCFLPLTICCHKGDTTSKKSVYTRVSNSWSPADIMDNVARIDSVTNWTAIEVKELFETLEGGEATYYYQNRVLTKIVARNYGETFQEVYEYYLWNGRILFVREKLYEYNRPLYYDSAAMKENYDDQTFDFNKSEMTEVAAYFENDTLKWLTHSKNSRAIFFNNYLKQEQHRIVADLKKLIKLSNTI